MKTTRFKFISILVFLSIIFNAVLPLSAYANSTSFSGNILPGIFGIVISTCSPIDVIGNAVNKIINDDKFSSSAPLQKNDAQRSGTYEANFWFLPPESPISKYYKEIKKTAGSVCHVKFLNFFAQDIYKDKIRPDKGKILFVFMILLAYFSILYRDIWKYRASYRTSYRDMRDQYIRMFFYFRGFL